MRYDIDTEREVDEGWEESFLMDNEPHPWDDDECPAPAHRGALAEAERELHDLFDAVAEPIGAPPAGPMERESLRLDLAAEGYVLYVLRADRAYKVLAADMLRLDARLARLREVQAAEARRLAPHPRLQVGRPTLAMGEVA